MQRIYPVEQIDWGRDYELLKQRLWVDAGSDGLNENDLEILRCGEETFLWESPPVSSAEKAVNLAGNAAMLMHPVRNRVILGAILYIKIEPGNRDSPDCRDSLHTVDAIAGTVSSGIFCEHTNVIVRWDFRGREGIRFVLAVSEGSAEEGRKRNDLRVVGHPRLL